MEYDGNGMIVGVDQWSVLVLFGTKLPPRFFFMT